jgi:sugar lactone lactonase YvrE
LAASGAYSITVVTAGPGGGTSAGQTFTVNNPSSTVQFTTGAETINEAAGTFSIPVTLTGDVAPAATTFGSFDSPNALAFDTAGNLYVANYVNGTVDKVTPSGAVSTFVSGFGNPRGLAFDAAGNLYVADGKADTVSKVTPAGVVSTFASGFIDPYALAFDASGNLYVSNTGSDTVSEVTPAGVVSTLPSIPTPTGLAFDKAGNLYVGNSDGSAMTGNTVEKVTPAGVVTVFASIPSAFAQPQYLAFDNAGNLYVANFGDGIIVKLTPAGAGSIFYFGIIGPQGLAFDATGNLYATGSYTNTVTELSSTVTVPYTLGGTAVGGTDYSGVTNGTLTFPTGQTTENITGTLIDDGSPDASKTLTFTLGNPSSNTSLGGPSVNTLTIGEPNPAPTLTSISTTSAKVGDPDTTIILTGSSFVNGSTVDFNGAAIATTFVNATRLTAVIPASDLTAVGADSITIVTAGPGGGTSGSQTFTVNPPPMVQFTTGNEAVNQTAGTFSIPVALTGAVAPIVSTFASGFREPWGLAFDADGNLFVANASDGTVSKVTPAGIVSTFASGFSDPLALASDASGNLYVANNIFNGRDKNLSTISEVTPAGVVSTFASGFTQPEGLAFDTAGNLYVADAFGQTVSKVTPAGVVSTFATGFGDPAGLAFDAAGNLYVANFGYGTVSKVTPAGVVSTFAAGFSNPFALASDAAGNLYVTKPSGSGIVDEVTPAGTVSTFASGFNLPDGIAVDAAGNVYVSNSNQTSNTVSEASRTVTVPFTLSGTAVGGTDYSGVAASPLTFAPGQTAAYITGTLQSDPGSSQTLTFTLGTPSSNVALGNPAANTLTITEQPAPAPVLTSISLTSAPVGSPNTTVSLTGSSFVPRSTADFNGAPIATTFVSATQLTAVIPASDFTTAGADMVTVVSAGPGGGASAGQTFTVNAASTTTAAANSSAVYNPAAQTVALSATVTSAAGTVNEGTETFTILKGTAVIGTAVTVNVVSGAAHANYALPAGHTAGSYTIRAVYNGDANFITSSDASHALTVNLPFGSTSSPVNTVVLLTNGSLVEYVNGTGSPVLLSNHDTIRAISTVLDVHGQTDIYAIIENTTPTGLVGPQYNNTLWEFISGAWSQKSSGPFAQISAALNSSGESIVFGLLTNGSLWEQGHFSGVDVGWSELSGNGTIKYISAVTDASGNDHVYVIDTPQVGAKYANTLWEHIPAGWRQDSTGQFSSISAGLNSAGQAVVYAILTNGQLWEQNPAFGPIGLDSGWHELSGANGLTDANGKPILFLSVQAAGPDEVFGIAQDQNTWKHTLTGNVTTNTQLTHGLLAAQLSATETLSGVDEVFETLIDGSFWEYSSALPGNHYEELLPGGVAASSTPE